MLGLDGWSAIDTTADSREPQANRKRPTRQTDRRRRVVSRVRKDITVAADLTIALRPSQGETETHGAGRSQFLTKPFGIPGHFDIAVAGDRGSSCLTGRGHRPFPIGHLCAVRGVQFLIGEL